MMGKIVKIILCFIVLHTTAQSMDNVDSKGRLKTLYNKVSENNKGSLSNEKEEFLEACKLYESTNGIAGYIFWQSTHANRQSAERKL